MTAAEAMEAARPRTTVEERMLAEGQVKSLVRGKEVAWLKWKATEGLSSLLVS